MKIYLDTKNAFKGDSFIIDVSLHLKSASYLSTIAILQEWPALYPYLSSFITPNLGLFFPSYSKFRYDMNA